MRQAGRNKGEDETQMTMKIGTRILAGYGVGLLIFLLVGAIAYRSTTQLVASADSVARSHQVKEALMAVYETLLNAETGQRGYILTGSDAYLEPYRTAVREVDGDLSHLRQLLLDNSGQQSHIDQLQRLASTKMSELAETVDVRREKGEAAAVAVILTGRGKNTMDDFRKVVASMSEDEDNLLKDRDRESRTTAQSTTTSIIAGGLIAALLALTVGLVTQRSITSPLTSFMDFARRIGAGDLSQKSSIGSGDELGELATNLNRMVDGLRSVARDTGMVAESLNAAITEISATTQQQAASSAEQAAAVQQATATMSEIRQSGAQISDRAKQVASSAEATTTASTMGLSAVQETSATMERIREQAQAVAENVIALSEKTQAVGEIITSVNDIAEQSHLLALNAAIQAAAAGDHGRTFSVVASEMKNLAGQSKQATVQVRAILGDIQRSITSSVMLTEEAVKRVESGRQQAGISDRTIRQLTDNIEESVRAFQQIVGGSSQQQIGFEQVTEAFRNIGIASQETAASAKQSEVAVANLAALSKQLRATVERYRL
jgi:methyl-accepting chemotaxis protein